MIGIVDVEIQSANPQMPLHPMRAYLNSPSSVRVRNVPRKVGTWQITSVQLVAAYPDNSIKTADCKLIGSVWVGTIAGSSTTGTSENGYTIFASGTDENGNAVSNYVLGKGLVEILETDGTITPSVDTAYVHLFEAEPETPKDGDVWSADGGYVIWQDGEAHALGGGFTPTEAQLAAMNSGVTSDTVAKADAALSRAEAVAGFTEWSVSPSGEGYFSWQISWTNGEWVATNPNMGTKTMSGDSAHDPSATSLQFDGLVEDVQYTATRTRLPTMADVNAKLDKADVVTPSLDVAIGKAADAQKTALGLNLLNQGKADVTSLPYALVVVTPTDGAPFVLAKCFPIVYTPSGGSAVTIDATDAGDLTFEMGEDWLVFHNGVGVLYSDRDGKFNGVGRAISAITFGNPATEPTQGATQVLGFTPTYALQDRTMNQVVVASPLPENGIALSFPDATAGKVRDFLVRLTIPAGDAPQIAYPEGVTFENADGSFPEVNTDESAAASTLLMFTETAPATGTGVNATPARFLVKGEALKEVS